MRLVERFITYLIDEFCDLAFRYQYLREPDMRYGVRGNSRLTSWAQKRQFVIDNILNPRERILLEVISFSTPGDYLEFGSYEGYSAITAYHIAQQLGRNRMRFFIFDSFQGLPAPTGIDSECTHFHKGASSCTLDAFMANLRASKVDLTKFIITPGWYEEVLNEKTKQSLDIKAAAIVYIDCDLYHSTVPVLKFVTDYLVDGSFLIFDDWYAFHGNPERGEQRAFYEWLNENPSISVSRYHDYGTSGTSFIVHRKT